jgi:NAD(P)-dependent dehydrogenase (short-subunit alcohol dehydrogenase family)
VPAPATPPALEDQAVLVTGASSGIGRAIALRLAAAGTRVVVHGRDAGRVESTVAAATEAGGRALPALGDLTDEESVRGVVRTAAEAFGELHGIVNNAGAALRGRTLEHTGPAEWSAMLETNLGSAWRVCRAGIEELRRRGGGSIVHVSSNLAAVAIPGLAAYIAAKGALSSLTRAMAVELGPAGIRVNAVCPGLVETEATAGHPGFDEQRAVYAAGSALGRIGRPQDVAGVVAFLLGPDAAWMTGQNLIVDGGYTIR